MRTRMLASVAISLALAGVSASVADEIRYVSENGVTYQERVRRVQRPVAETVIEERQETVLKDRYSTAIHETEQTVLTPVTEYRWEARVHGVWNPFVPAHVRYEMVPHTTLQPVVQTVRTPVTTRELVPEQRIVQVPVRKLAVEEREEISRVAVTSVPAGTSIVVRETGKIGGVAQLESDPPKQGTKASRY